MHLKSLEISGFKSFGKKAELSFTTPITSIVGPNGSGKSNVAEAFRFVLGEQSMKTLRGKKGEDMIWNGSNAVPRGNRAAASITFDNRARFLQADFDEVIIERIVHRDGVNEYKINGTNVRLRDITELLAGASIGASGHHIISQGEADRILSANPKERREMIEDALGLRVYQYKKRESERKLEKTEENKQQVEALRRENAPHLKFLAKQMERLKKAEAMRETLAEKYLEYLHREDLYLKYEGERIHAARQPLTAEQWQLELELTDAKAVLEKSEAAGKDRDGALSLEKELSDIRRVRDSLSRDIGRLEGEISSEKRRLHAAENTSGAPIPWSAVSTLVQDIRKEFAEAEKIQDIAKLHALVRDIRERLVSFLDRFKAENAELDKDTVNRLEADMAMLAKKEKDLSDKETLIGNRIAAVRTHADESREQGRQAEREVYRILAAQGELRARLAADKAEGQRHIEAREEFKREVAEGIVLVGRRISEYPVYVVRKENGAQVEVAEMAQEPRDAQVARKRELEKLKIRLEESGAGGGEDIAKEFNEAQKRDEYLAKELTDLEQSALALHGVIDDLTAKLDHEFKQGIEKISSEFNTFFGLMFGSGVAKLVLVLPPKKKKKDILDLDGEESEDLEEGGEESAAEREGVDVSVSLPHKRIKGLEMLSGGERALTSIALIFAMSQVNPPPFLILDETDAALDEANSRRYGDMIENLAKKSQLILITHNRETMSRAGVLYGVTMGSDGVSKLLSVKFEEAVKVAK